KYACKPTTGRFVFQTLSGIATEAAIEPSNRTRWSSATVPSELRVVAVSTTGAVAVGVGVGVTAPDGVPAAGLDPHPVAPIRPSGPMAIIKNVFAATIGASLFVKCVAIVLSLT